MTTENNVAAQAGDEPMRAARSIGTDRAFEAAAKALHLSWSPEGVHALIAAADAFVAAQVSPRATADVERNLRAELINAGALRQYCHNDGSVGFVTAYDFDITNRFLAAIATTKPGA